MFCGLSRYPVAILRKAIDGISMVVFLLRLITVADTIARKHCCLVGVCLLVIALSLACLFVLVLQSCRYYRTNFDI